MVATEWSYSRPPGIHARTVSKNNRETGAQFVFIWSLQVNTIANAIFFFFFPILVWILPLNIL